MVGEVRFWWMWMDCLKYDNARRGGELKVPAEAQVPGAHSPAPPLQEGPVGLYRSLPLAEPTVSRDPLCTPLNRTG